MTPEAHRRKAERIERTLAKLRPGDYEMRIDGAVLAASHYVNLALHRLGILPETRDIIHTEYLEVIDYRRLAVVAEPLVEAIEAIEELRAPFVRGSAPGGIEAGERALELLVSVRETAVALEPIGFALPKYVPMD
jgi:hypothetical protein